MKGVLSMDENKKHDELQDDNSCENVNAPDNKPEETPQAQTDAPHPFGREDDQKTNTPYEINRGYQYWDNNGGDMPLLNKGLDTGRSSAVKSSRKFLIVTLSVVAVLLIFAIIGVSLFYIKVLKPLLGEIDLDDDAPQIPTNVEILDSDFDLTQQSTPGKAYDSLADAYDATHGVFVEINASFESQGSIGAGSGFIVARMDGNVGYYIVTNNHVVGGASKVTVRLSDGKEYTAEKTILTDEMTDIAVIAIKETADLPVAKLGKSSNVRVGENIYVIGNPLGTFAGTLTNGIISSRASDIYIGNHYMSLLQTTAAINPGNSGGPMFNMAGEIVGIVNAKYVATDVEGLGFAIPIDTAIDIVEQMIRKGYVELGGRHDLGITAAQNLYGTGGLWVSSLSSESSLITALGKEGIAHNSLNAYQINAINGISFESGIQANMYIDGLMAGDTITVTVSVYELQFTKLVPVAQKTVTIKLGQKLATN